MPVRVFPLTWNTHVPLNVTLYSDDVARVQVSNDTVDVSVIGGDGRQYVRGVRRVHVELTDAASQRIGQALMQAFADGGQFNEQTQADLVRLIRGIDTEGEL